MSNDIYLFHKPLCGACELLKKFLTSHRIDYKAIDGMSAEGATLMRVNGVFLSYYPAMCLDGRLYEYSDLFDEKGGLLADHILEIVGDAQ